MQASKKIRPFIIIIIIIITIIIIVIISLLRMNKITQQRCTKELFYI